MSLNINTVECTDKVTKDCYCYVSINNTFRRVKVSDLLALIGVDEVTAETIAEVLEYVPADKKKVEAIEKELAIESEQYPGCYYRTVDGEKEWVNPPITANKEFRTTERFVDGSNNLKAVYTQLFSFECAEGKQELTGSFLTNCIVVRSYAYTSNFALPRTVCASTLKQEIDIWRDGHYVYMQQSDVASSKVNVRLWYCKN